MSDATPAEVEPTIDTSTWFKLEPDDVFRAEDTINQVQAINNFLRQAIDASEGGRQFELQNDEPYGLSLILNLQNALLNRAKDSVNEELRVLRQRLEDATPPEPEPTPEELKEQALESASWALEALGIEPEDLIKQAGE